jgi:thymidylate synthase
MNKEQLHRDTFYQLYKTLKKNGQYVSPRGQKTIEIENFNAVFPPYVRFCNFESRKFNLNYVKKEFLWYLKGDKYDTSIAQHAKLWNSFIDSEGVIQSNYGQYIFGQLNQFQYVLDELTRDPDSRRASIVILQPYHTLETKLIDVPCTYGLNFRIRNNKLNMTVKMRSNDAYFGLASDVPIFSFIHEMLFVCLRENNPQLEYGNYHHFVESFHIYERHFEFLNNLNEESKYSLIDCPEIQNAEEVEFLRKLDFSSVPSDFKFTKWLAKND